MSICTRVYSIIYNIIVYYYYPGSITVCVHCAFNKNEVFFVYRVLYVKSVKCK